MKKNVIYSSGGGSITQGDLDLKQDKYQQEQILLLMKIILSLQVEVVVLLREI